MQHNGSDELLAYWNGLRGTRAAPERNEIVPSAIAGVLAETFILQARAGGPARFRLAGTRLCTIYNRELTATEFPTLWQAQDRSTIARMARHCMIDKAILRQTFEGRSARKRKALFELILLPLAGEARDHYLIGAILTLGRPFWLESDPIVENRVQSAPVSALPRLPDPGNAQLPVPGRKVSHLRVLDGGKAGSRRKDRD